MAGHNDSAQNTMQDILPTSNIMMRSPVVFLEGRQDLARLLFVRRPLSSEAPGFDCRYSTFGGRQ